MTTGTEQVIPILKPVVAFDSDSVFAPLTFFGSVNLVA